MIPYLRKSSMRCVVRVLSVGRRLLFIERCPSRIPLCTSQPLVSQLHNHHANRNITPSLKQLQAQLVFLSKTGQVDEALKTVHTAKQLNYPLHSNVICQLLNFATKWDNKYVFKAALDFLKDNEIIYDEQVYTTIIRGLLRFYGFSDAVEVYGEMISEGFIPRRNLLHHLFEDCLSTNDAENSCVFFDRLLARSDLPPVQLLLEFITLCLNEHLHDYVMKLLEYYSLLNIPLEVELVQQLEWYFEAYNKRADNGHCWNTVLTTVSNKGICSNCQVKLPPNVLTKEQMTKLCTFITEELEQETKLLSSSQTDRKQFTASQIHSLKKLINNKGPFDYVIDGLNVAYGGNSKFNFNKILQLCSKLNRNVKDAKMLIIGGYQLIQHLMINSDRQMSKQAAIQYYNNQGIYLFIKHNRVLDDLYLINATLMSGGDTLLVSNDQFRDHLHHVASSDAAMIRLLRQWQLSSQVKMLFSEGSLATLVYPPSYGTTVHLDHKQGHYHIPATNHQWLCVTRKKYSIV